MEAEESESDDELESNIVEEKLRKIVENYTETETDPYPDMDISKKKRKKCFKLKGKRTHLGLQVNQNDFNVWVIL